MLAKRLRRRKNEIKNEYRQQLEINFPGASERTITENDKDYQEILAFERRFFTNHLDEDIELNEKEAFANHQFCHLPRINISEVDWKRLNDKLAEDRYNPELLKVMACLTATAVITPGPNGPKFLPEHIRTWIKNLKVLSSGSYGDAFTATLGSSEPNLVIKAPIDDDPSTLAGTFHELIVGFFLNNLRAKTVGLAYVYGGFTTSLPILGGDPFKPKDVLTYANFKAPIQYLIYERIAPSIPCGDFFDKRFNPNVKEFSFERGCGLNDFVNILIQLTTTLQIAFENYDFTHYDLHSNNVLLLNLGKMVSLPIHMQDGSIFYLETWFLVMIIDYGMAHVRIDGKNYGFSYREFDVYPDRSFPAYDFFKFLFFAGYWSGESNPNIIKWVDLFSPFFDSVGTFSGLYEKGRDFFLPYDSEARLLTPADFYSFLDQEFGEVVDQLYNISPRYEVFECHGNCQSSSQILNDLNALSRKAPSDPYAFYDLVSNLEKDSTPRFRRLANQFKINFQYQPAIQKLISDTETVHQTILSSKDVKLKMPSATLFINPASFKNYMAEIDKVGTLIESLQEYSNIAQVWNYLRQIHAPYLGKSKIKQFNYDYYGRSINRLADYLEELQTIGQSAKRIETKDGIATSRKNALIQRMSRYNYLLQHWEEFLRTLKV